MFITTEEFLKHLEKVQYRFEAKQEQYLSDIIDTPKFTNLEIDTSSPSSTRLWNFAMAQNEIVRPEILERLKSIEIYGVDFHVCDAFPRVSEQRRQIIIFDGFLYLLRFCVDLYSVLSLMERYRTEEVIDLDGSSIDEGLAFSMAAHALMVEAVQTGHVLIDIGDMLGPNANRQAAIGFKGAILFLLLHELGHIDCGHLEDGSFSERSNIELLVSETLDDAQKKELEADDFAMAAIDAKIRNGFVSSAIFSLLPFAFIEVFSGPVNLTHPLTVNRIGQLVRYAKFPDNPELELAAEKIANGHIRRFLHLAEQRTNAGGSVIGSISRTMPLETAYDVIKRIKQNVANAGGLPDI